MPEQAPQRASNKNFSAEFKGQNVVFDGNTFSGKVAPGMKFDITEQGGAQLATFYESTNMQRVVNGWSMLDPAFQTSGIGTRSAASGGIKTEPISNGERVVGYARLAQNAAIKPDALRLGNASGTTRPASSGNSLLGGRR